MPVSVIIPTLDEEQHVAAAIDSAFAAGAAEVIVADGGSTDRTCAVAAEADAKVIRCERMRAKQLNAGAATASGDFLLFLHADTLLPAGACRAVETAAAPFGGFRLSFLEPHRSLRLGAFLINARTRITRQPWGDQAQFVRRGVFHEVHGYRELPIMEDYEFARRMCRAGSVAILPMHVRTSGRRFLARGLLRTVITNWAIVAAWHLGVAPERLARWYRAQPRRR